MRKRSLYCCIVTILSLSRASAQETEPKPSEHFRTTTEKEEVWSFHFQATAIPQGHPGIHSTYVGPNSLSPRSEYATSYTETLFLGRRLWEGAAFYVNPEVAGGQAISVTTGVAGFANGEMPRVSDPAPTFILARLYFEQTFALGSEMEDISADLNQLAGTRPKSRLTFRIGKMSAEDLFDNNSYSHDPRTQFMNWAIMYNGAWDYPADTRGYTGGALVEWINPQWALRYGTFLMPQEANQLHMDFNIYKAHGHALEGEVDWTIATHPGAMRLMFYYNKAFMGDYRDAIEDPSFNLDITQTRKYSAKYGACLNVEQAITEELGAFLRAGWNDGQTETFVFTEIERTFSAGLSLKGAVWNRPDDTFGIAYVVNELSEPHKNYLAAGGVGFLIGDGRLNYEPESIFEVYYSLKLWGHLSLTADFQYVNNPAYNADRGPVPVCGLRVHLEF